MPQQEISIIRSLLDPTIILDSLEINDLDTGTSPAAAETGQPNQTKEKQVSKDLGTNYPFIEINNYVFNETEIETFEICYTGFIPTVRLVAGIKGKTFPSAAMPKDGDLMSVFIRAKNNVFKPIRNDYRITNVSSFGADSEGRGGIYTITGELFVPRLYDQVIKSYVGTSYAVLKQIAQELKLGFASNDTLTNDSQTWINPGGDTYNFILDLCEHAWKDEKSFFTVFIDIYYHINFVNVNNQFSEGTEVDMALLTNLQITDSVGGELAAKRLEEGSGNIPKILSNFQDLKGTPAFVHHYNVKNNSNTVSATQGYKKYTQFFEQNSETFWSIFTDPINTPGAVENKIILKGRTKKPGAPKEEFWKTQNVYAWKGIQYSAPEGNVHEKYVFAYNWNERNKAELNKMYIDVELDRGNFNIYRGERIPLVLIVAGDNQYQNILSTPETDNKSSAFPQPIIDKFYSGYYMVSGMKFSYGAPSADENGVTRAGSGFMQNLTLTRREWPTPV